VAEKREAIKRDHKDISVNRQCELLGLSRSAYYYKAKEMNPGDLKIMHLIDKEFTDHPFFGSRRLSDWLAEQGFPACRSKVSRLMKVMGIEAIYPRKSLSARHPDHKIYPYLLRGLAINHSDQVWCMDITYIRLKRGYAYLTVVMDWYSRYVISWELSMSMGKGFCTRCLNRTLDKGTPEIFNTDQGSQFTSNAFTQILKDSGVKISMDGKGRAFDNIMIERLWRTVKYEDVFINDYEDYYKAYSLLGKYFDFYNNERKHSSLGKKTPSEFYHMGRKDRKVPA
jgi:putative transposase